MGLGEILKNIGRDNPENLQQPRSLYDIVKGGVQEIKDGFSNFKTPILEGSAQINNIMSDDGLLNSEIFQKNLYTRDEARKYFPIAHTNLINALGGLDYPQPYNGTTVFQNRSDLQNLTPNGTGINNLMDKLGIPQNSRGVYYHADSKLSEKLAKSKVLNEYIDNNRNKLMNGQIGQDLINFKWYKYPDAFAGIQHATMYRPHIENGRFKTDIVDWYDFNRRDDKNIYNIPNNWGADMQDKGKLENYANVYYIDEEIPLQTNKSHGLFNRVTPINNNWRYR